MLCWVSARTRMKHLGHPRRLRGMWQLEKCVQVANSPMQVAASHLHGAPEVAALQSESPQED
jgi:hypothetical protein